MSEQTSEPETIALVLQGLDSLAEKLRRCRKLFHDEIITDEEVSALSAARELIAARSE